MKQFSFINLALSFIALMIFWLVMSGHFDLIHISQGVVCAGIVIAVNYRLKQHKFFNDEMNDLGQLRFLRAFYYVFWLFIQIIQSGFQVAFVILRPNMPVNTHILKFSVDLPSTHAKMILGNSITLTPGTLTIDIIGDEFTVHALTPASFEGIVSDEMPRQVLKLFTKEDRNVIRNIQLINSSDGLR
ncbi:MAG: Na+/H+ antiporter subunit E [Balneolaceae bacterium]